MIENMESDAVSEVQEKNTTDNKNTISEYIQAVPENTEVDIVVGDDTEEHDDKSKQQTDNLTESLKRMSPMPEDEIQDYVSETSMADTQKRKKVELYAKDTGPKLYQVKGNVVTPPIITKNLPKVFEYLPIFGKPKSRSDLDDFYCSKIREFVGCSVNDEEFADLEKYCSPDNLKTGKELVMTTKVPQPGMLESNSDNHNDDTSKHQDPPNLYTLKKYKLRIEKDLKGIFVKKLKYRGVRMMPHIQEDNEIELADIPGTSASQESPDEELEPGKDILYRIRVYRPYAYTPAKERQTRSRHSVFCCDMVVCGRQRLTALRDRFVCHNDFDMRIDVSNNPDLPPNAKAKDVFPSGFLFINNVFYVDTRPGCADYSRPVREWAARRGLGRFPARDMAAVALQSLSLKLGHPDVYVHQGNCEHVFLFSEVRLLNASDPLLLSQYPYSRAVGKNQSMYCTTCAEFCAKWIVVGCKRVPFDPAFFCDSCLKLYLYKDGEKIGDFKAYSYRGNALNVLKPQ